MLNVIDDNKRKVIDSSFVGAYLRNGDENKELIPYIDSFSSLIDKYSEIRGVAETENSQNGFFEVSNKKFLPISAKSVDKCIYANSNEPPQQLISIIAGDDYQLIKQVGQSLRRILRRERNKISMGRAQQMDSSCLLWLSKQPGRSTAEKAGSKQEVLAVIRYESFDTLENRVFKDFLKLCISEGITYKKNYDKKFPHSHRVDDVKRLVALCYSLLMLPELQSVSALKVNPKPNYVLQKNPIYSLIWKRYLELRRKHKLVEDLWPYRNTIWKEYFALLFDLWFHKNDQCKSIVQSRYWISEISYEHKDGFLRDSNCLNIFAIGMRKFIPVFFSSESSKNEIMMKVFGDRAGLYKFQFQYVPNGSQADSVNEYCIALYEDDSADNHTSVLSFDFYDDNDMAKVFYERLSVFMRENRWLI